MAIRKPSDVTQMQAVKQKEPFSVDKAYQWDTQDSFVLTGLEVDILQKALVLQTRGEISEYDKFLWLQRGLNTMNNILKEAYEQGIIQEKKPELPLQKPEVAKVVEEAVEEKTE